LLGDFGATKIISFPPPQPPLEIGFDAKDKNYNLINFRGVPQVNA
jgi:hypothetical protein